jgi:anti-anti-sigma regulatory factor
MDQDSNGIFVARNDRGAFVRVVGRGTFQNAQCLRQFGMQAIEQGCPAISLDLCGCKAMDSTFLGVLAGFGLKLRALGREDGLHLFNTCGHTLESCQTLGLDRLAQLESGPPNGAEVQPPPGSGFRKLPDSDLSAAKNKDKSSTAAVMLEAHEDLCRCDGRNEAKFKDVKKLLRNGAERQSPATQI